MSRHLLSIDTLPRDQIIAILNDAQELISKNQHLAPELNRLQGKTIVNCFLEPSTRTRSSFELAAKRLGAEVLNIEVDQSALKKGESLLDMLHTLEAMHVDAFVIRHGLAGIMTQLQDQLHTHAILINAGDGAHAHPTQALLDLLTIRQHKPDLPRLSVAIIGDIVHSRVANSLRTILETCGVTDIRLVGPEILLPELEADNPTTRCFTELTPGIADADIVVALRLQRERMVEADIPDEEHYFETYGLTTKRLKEAKEDAIVMHPGPMNRNIEIASEVADGDQSVILQQVTNGVAIRMAVFSHCLLKGD